MSQTRKVAIVGAGYAGLTLAVGLAKKTRGLEVVLYEQAPSLAEVGAGVAIAGPAVHALRALGIDLEPLATLPVARQLRCWKDGRLLSVQEYGWRYYEMVGAPYLTLHRATLQQQLLEAVRSLDVPLYLHARVSQATEHPEAVLLSFESGETATADFVIGADGVKSQVRAAIAPEVDPVYSGEIGFRAVVRASRFPSSLPDPDCLQAWLGPDTHCVFYGIDGGKWINFLYVYRPSRLPEWTQRTNRIPGDPREAADLFERLGWHPGIVETITQGEGDLHYWALMDIPWTFRTWYSKRVLLIGDAAHAPLPHMGMGAGLAIEDAYILGHLLQQVDESSWHAVFSEFTRIRYPRTSLVQRWTRSTGLLYKYSDPVLVAQRDRTLHRLEEARLRWVHRYNPVWIEQYRRVSASPQPGVHPMEQEVGREEPADPYGRPGQKSP